MRNYWLERALMPIENEVLLVKQSHETTYWYEKMSSLIPVMFTDKKNLRRPEDYGPKLGLAHHIKLTRFGIEAILKAPRKYHRYPYYVIHDKINVPNDPFWIVFYRT
jgi:hypothetical protein